jgi:CubicO group peptidase (beta-lactamase class C family)
MHLDDFARKHIFSPLRIDRFEWRRGPDGYTAGQGNLSVTLKAMGSLGQLVLDKGRSGGRQLISRNWIDRSIAPVVPISHADPYADAYGYMWYTRTHRGGPGGPSQIRVHFASGNGGNKIYVVPELGAVVAIASAAYGRGYAQRRSQEILLRILGSIRG